MRQKTLAAARLKSVKGDNIWTRTDQTHFIDERRNVSVIWDEAETLSYGCGFEFSDRYGVRQNVGRKQSVVADVVDLFLEHHGEGIKRLYR